MIRNTIQHLVKDATFEMILDDTMVMDMYRILTFEEGEGDRVSCLRVRVVCRPHIVEGGKGYCASHCARSMVRLGWDGRCPTAGG